MKILSLCRIGAIAALAALSAPPSHAGEGIVRDRMCAAVPVECRPGARFSYETCRCVPQFDENKICPALDCGRGRSMNRTTCACMLDESRDYRPYNALGVSAAAPAAGEFNALGRQVGAISSAMGNQDTSMAAEGLNALFVGGGSKKYSSGISAVAAGTWGVKPAFDSRKKGAFCK